MRTRLLGRLGYWAFSLLVELPLALFSWVRSV
jgi:hypothetical protein